MASLEPKYRRIMDSFDLRTVKDLADFLCVSRNAIYGDKVADSTIVPKCKTQDLNWIIFGEPSPRVAELEAEIARLRAELAECKRSAPSLDAIEELMNRKFDDQKRELREGLARDSGSLSRYSRSR